MPQAIDNANELLARRANVLTNARAILDKAETEKRDLTAEDRQNYDRLFDEAGALKDQANALAGDHARRTQLDQAMSELDQSRGRVSNPTIPGTGDAYRRAGNDGANLNGNYELKFSRRGDNGRPLESCLSFPPGSPAWHRHRPEYMQAMRSYMGNGHIGAALQTDISTAGGYMVLPESFVAEYLHDVDNIMWMRKICRLFTTNAQTLGAVKRTTRASTFAWGSELSAPTADTALAFGKRTLTPHYMTGEIQISRDLMRSALLPIDEIVRYEIGRDAGYLEETAFQLGTGFGQPLGVFTASNDGIDTSRDVSTGNTTTSIGADNLRYAKYTLKVQYREDPSTRWLFHRNTINQISRLKDGNGQYLWRDSITVGDPDMLLGYAVVESEFSPNTYTTGLYVGLLGAFRYYWICDSLEMDILTLVEKDAATNQIDYVCRKKTDGMAQIAEAFVRLKLA